MSMKTGLMATLVLLLAACSPPPLSLPPGSDTAKSPKQGSAAPKAPRHAAPSLSNEFSEDKQVQQLGACALGAIQTGDGAGWERRVDKLRALHKEMLPGKEGWAVESDATKAVFDARVRLEKEGVTKDTLATYVEANCDGL